MAKGGDRTIGFIIGGQALSFVGSDFLNRWSLPNFYFHLCMAYALLRHNGVPLGKRDFLSH